jgi:hypothetical protein
MPALTGGARACLQPALSRASDNGDGDSVYRRKRRRKSIDYKQGFFFFMPSHAYFRMFPAGGGESRARASARNAQSIDTRMNFCTCRRRRDFFEIMNEGNSIAN